MTRLELLAPARNADIGIAAIDCGADAVYMAGPAFGARQAAGNPVGEIRRLCDYAHRFGAKIFITLNTILFDSETDEARRLMLEIQDAGADALIVQDMAIPVMAAELKNSHGWHLPLHASTQCAIRTPEQARFLESLGFSRLILERELSLSRIQEIRNATGCEIEFFAHGALCVCYSGQCYLSQEIAGRSANRGACIQACRARYDLTDADGKTIVRNRALLSLKDYSLRDRIEDLAGAGVVSFKIEGRLKNESYVRNVVREYSSAIDEVISRHPDRYSRASFGHTSEGFVPDSDKTFNRGYTELFLDGIRGKWASGDSAKAMGEYIGTAAGLDRDNSIIRVRPANQPGIRLNNGDGFSFVSKRGNVVGFRGDVCTGNEIRCKPVPELFTGAKIYRNSDIAFEKTLEQNRCVREIPVGISLTSRRTGNGYVLTATALSEDGRFVSETVSAENGRAENEERMRAVLEGNLSKTGSIYRFNVSEINAPDGLPFMPVSAVNAIRRAIADRLDSMPCRAYRLASGDILKGLDDGTSAELFTKAFPDGKVTYRSNVSNRLARRLYEKAGAVEVSPAFEQLYSPEVSAPSGIELMRTKYCIRHELGLCPGHHRSGSNADLFLMNNGRRLRLHFDCANCEMTVHNAPMR